MKNTSVIGSLKTFEMVIIVFLIVYLALPVQTPQWLMPFIDTPLGIAFIAGATLATFFFANPLLAVLFVFFAYTLLRRSSNGSILSRISTQSVVGTSNITDGPAKVTNEMDPILPSKKPSALRKKKSSKKKTLAADEMTYPMTYQQSTENIERVAIIERDLSEGTYTREEQSLQNDQAVITQPPISLEEEIVRTSAPIDRPMMSVNTRTQFQPVATNVGSFASF
jgi:hypothetical protein